MQDTVATARQVRASQGSHEGEVSFGGEGDLYCHYTTCSKNPDHSNFISVDKFDVACLPPGYQDNDIVASIQGLSRLTVRVSVKHTSRERPDFYSCGKPYPFSIYKGSDMMRTGSGWVRSVQKKSVPDNGICRCKKCQTNTSSHAELAEITIRTAAHVVHDDLEGKYTECHFFYDKGETLEDCQGVHILSEATSVVSDISGDWCDMTFLTEDINLADMLDKLTIDYFDLHKKVWENYPSDENTTTSSQELNLAVIVSHPHGCSKKISVGHYQARTNATSCSNFSTYTYTTATCNGSSGAPVFILGKSRRWSWCSHAHSGNCDENKNLNYSGEGAN